MTTRKLKIAYVAYKWWPALYFSRRALPSSGRAGLKPLDSMLWPSPASHFSERETLAREASDFPEISSLFGDKLAPELHTLASLGLGQMVMYLLPCFLPLLGSSGQEEGSKLKLFFWHLPALLDSPRCGQEGGQKGWRWEGSVEQWFGARVGSEVNTWVPIPPLPLGSCVTLGRWLAFSVPQFPTL